MMRVKNDLLLGEWAVLALLSEGPMHGYALASLFSPDGEVGQVWTMGQPRVYRALEVLEKDELIEVDSTKPGDRAPRRIDMVATDIGRARVDAWFERPESQVKDLRSAFLLKLLLLDRRGRQSGKLLKAQREVLISRRSDLKQEADESEQNFPMVSAWRLIMCEAALDFVEQAIEGEEKSYG